MTTAIASTVSGSQPAGAIRLDAPDAAAQEPGLSRAQIAAVTISIALGVVVAGYGLAGSYLSISELAERHDVPLAGLVPAGIDGGLVAVVVLDLVLTWIGAPVGWLRQLVRILSIGTVAANAIAGWPDLVAVGLHAAAPLMLLAMLEAGRSVLLRRLGETRGTRRESIPAIRWVLAPWRTFLLWRRMALWQITSYRTAIDTELKLRGAVIRLRAQYGRRWRRHAPADLVWMLRTGVAVDEAAARVRALAGIDNGTEPAQSMPDTSCADPRTADEPPVHGSTPLSSDLGDAPTPSEIAAADRLAEAMRLNRQHWQEAGRPISAEILRQRLHVSAETSRGLTRAVREADRVTILGAVTAA